MLPVSSFRDPDGCCFAWGKRILRVVNPTALAEIEPFLASATAAQFVTRQQLVPTRKLSAGEVGELRQTESFEELARRYEMGAVLEHERVDFPSYPYEWPPEMLYAAGMLTLDLAQACLAEGYGLKDATPYNVLFRGSKPVFIDVLSFERRHPGDPVWKPHAQFCRTFLLPLLAYKYWGVRPADVFTKRRDGFETNEVYRFCGPLRKFLPPFLTQVSLPTWLSRRGVEKSIYRDHILQNHEQARFVLESLFNRLRRALQRVEPKPGRRTVWSDYKDFCSYTEANFSAKEEFVNAALAEFKPSRVLDVGSNTGHFSDLAARAGAQVVAIDSDLNCVGTLWRQAQEQNQNILPLVLDLCRPSAAKGWRNRECASFLERATGAFDAVLMLAVLHHLLVTERIPLNEVLDLVAELTTGLLIIEFVGPGDEMFQTIARGREHLHVDLTPAAFEAACRQRFEIVRAKQLDSTYRRLYLLKKRVAGNRPPPPSGPHS
jgi:2-polyprenyl-3-methyl-5-hydroxy-6-metoxy-1,4-benzoquinol methylase